MNLLKIIFALFIILLIYVSFFVYLYNIQQPLLQTFVNLNFSFSSCR